MSIDDIGYATAVVWAVLIVSSVIAVIKEHVALERRHQWRIDK